MTPFEFALAVIGFTIVWFDVLQMPMRIKEKMGWAVHEFVKPLDCFFCSCFWFSLTAILFLPILKAIAAVFIVIVLSKLLQSWMYQ